MKEKWCPDVNLLIYHKWVALNLSQVGSPKAAIHSVFVINKGT